jgi:hypothetical protein
MPGALSMTRSALSAIFSGFVLKRKAIAAPARVLRCGSVTCASPVVTGRAKGCQKFQVPLLRQEILFVLFIKSDTVGREFLEVENRSSRRRANFQELPQRTCVGLSKPNPAATHLL